MGAPILLKLTEYQASQNKAHDHPGSFSGANVTDSFNTAMFAVWSDKNTGFYRYYKDSMGLSYPGSGSGWGLGRGSINYTPSGSVTVSSDGTVSKPPTVAFMWILRYA